MTTEPSSEQPTQRRRGWRTSFVVATAFVAAVLGAFVNESFGQGFGPPWHALMGPPSEAQIEELGDRMVRHLAIEIDATAEQQGKLQTIVKSAIKDLVPMRDKFFAVRQQARDLLTQTSIDRAAIEKLRTDQMTPSANASCRPWTMQPKHSHRSSVRRLMISCLLRVPTGGPGTFSTTTASLF
jgi:periplasmic protein CpxP/Spy